MVVSPHAQTILIVLHHEHSSPGRIGRFLQDQGYKLDIRRTALGDALPRSVEDFAGVVIFGGAMSVNDSDDWIKREIDWISTPLAQGTPFLGICLGAQMLARRLGAKVAPRADGCVEIGYYSVRPKRGATIGFGGRMPTHVYQWHSEGFDVPNGATALAEGDLFKNQAFLYGRNAVALQFHPEVTYATMCKWTVEAYERMQLPCAQPPIAHLEGWHQYDRAVAIWLKSFLRDWIETSAKNSVSSKSHTHSQRLIHPAAREFAHLAL